MAGLTVNLLHNSLMRKMVNLLADMVGDKQVPEKYRQRIQSLIKRNDHEETNGNVASLIIQ